MLKAETKPPKLAGWRILVVEDEYFVADEIQYLLEQEGAEVVGPTGSLGAAREIAAREALDCVVLDINLKGELVYGFADELSARGVPFIFATGYDKAVVPSRFAQAERVEKPFSDNRLLDAILRQYPLGGKP